MHLEFLRDSEYKRRCNHQRNSCDREQLQKHLEQFVPATGPRTDPSILPVLRIDQQHNVQIQIHTCVNEGHQRSEESNK